MPVVRLAVESAIPAYAVVGVPQSVPAAKEKRRRVTAAPF